MELVREMSAPEPSVAPDEPAAGALVSVRRFHASLREALQTAFESLLLDLASEVLGRELLLEPADLQRIVERTLERYAGLEPLRVRVHPGDAAALELEIPLLCDDTLMRGDAIVELRDGEIDASLGVRLEALLESISP